MENEKQVELKLNDYRDIFSGSRRNWLNKAANGKEYFNVECIIESFLEFTKNNNIKVIQGKLFKDE